MAFNHLPLSPIYKIKADTGIDIGKETLLMVDKTHFKYPQGTLLVLNRDDRSWSPEFKPQGAPDNVFEYVNMNRLAIFDPTNPYHIALAAKAKLQGH